MRQSFPITTLLIAAVAGAQPAPPAAPAAGSNATHEVRSRGSGATELCTCHASGQDGVTCEQCTPKAIEPSQSSIRILSVRNESERALWDRLLTDLRADETINELTSQVGFQGHRVTGGEDPENAWLSFHAQFRCRNAPSGTDRFERFIGNSLSRSAIVAGLRAEAERVCGRSGRASSVRADTEPQTTWAGCPAQDDYDRGGFNRTANPKIRITARPESHHDQWSRLRLDLVMDDLIYRCSRELLIDPVSASGAGAEATFRANVTLVCANDPTRRAEFDTGVGEMDAGTFRLYVGQQLRRICGIDGATARRHTQ